MVLMNHTVVVLACFLERHCFRLALSTTLQLFLSWTVGSLYFCVFSLGRPGVWGIKGLARSVFHSEQFRPSQLGGTCILKGRKMFYISLTKQGSPVSFFHIQAWTSNSSYYSSSCLSHFFLLYVVEHCSESLSRKGSLQKKEGDGIQMWMCVFALALQRNLYMYVYVCAGLSVWLRTDCVAWSRKVWAL